MKYTNNIYLPTLKNIKIDNFSLYSKTIDYKFVEGTNLIIGGNGTGKTTFINIIKYSIIGLYKKDTDVSTYQGERKERRTIYPYTYFSGRMNKTYEKNEDARVSITFTINKTTFKVVRNLYNIKLEEVVVTENGKTNILDGKLILQKDYDKFSTNDKKKDYLQYKYESKVAEISGLSSFDDLIMFINDVLTFDERRKTIFWDTEFQTKIMHKYFSDPVLNRKYEGLIKDVKYYDSLSRHTSEEAKAIKRMIDDFSKNKNASNNSADTLEKEVEAMSVSLKENKKENNDLLKKLRKLYSELDNLNQDIKKRENKLLELKEKYFANVWEKLNRKYNIYAENIRINNICPMCNKALPDNKKDIILNENECFLCGQHIISDNKENNNKPITDTKYIIEKLYSKKQNIEKNIFDLENECENIEKKIRKLENDILDKKIQINNNKQNEKSQKDGDGNEVLFMTKRYNDLLQKMKEQRNKSEENKKESEKISLEIDEQRTEITKKLSDIFVSYANSFTGLNCYLKYEDDDENMKRYIPVINDIERIDEESLSESQRFFIDHSFRMSLLQYFYKAPSFFICETPESSLDISYEENAANIFLNYLNKPNSLILTVNINKNTFLEYIIKKSKRINYLNLLEIGKCSDIQSNNESLAEITKNIEGLINGKK